MAGAGLAGVTTLPVVAANEGKFDGLNKEEQNILVDNYGREEAKAYWNIAKPFVKKARAGKLDDDKALERIYKIALNSDKTRSVAADIQDTKSRKPKQPEQSINSSVRTDVTTDSVSITINYGETDWGGSGGATANADYNLPSDITADVTMREKATAAVAGSAWSYARLYGKYTADSTGDHRIDVGYFRDGNTVSADTTFSLFVRGPNGIEKKSVESPHGDVRGDVSRYRDFNLISGEEYDVGLEVMGEASTAAGGSYSDYFELEAGGVRRRAAMGRVAISVTPI